MNSTLKSASRPVTNVERPRLFERILGLCLDDAPCLLWVGATCRACPVISHRGRSCSVRRLMHEALTGRCVPRGLVAAARCRRDDCVSPDCLMVVPVGQLRQIDASRGVYNHVPGDIVRRRASQAHAQYPESLVQLAREMEGSRRLAALATGISQAHVTRIRAGHARVPAVGIWKGLQ